MLFLIPNLTQNASLPEALHGWAYPFSRTLLLTDADLRGKLQEQI